jgi:hypothetical protein
MGYLIMFIVAHRLPDIIFAGIFRAATERLNENEDTCHRFRSASTGRSEIPTAGRKRDSG